MWFLVVHFHITGVRFPPPPPIHTGETMKCSICKGEIGVTSFGWDQGNNAEPVNDGRCCDTCDDLIVIPKRIGMVLRDAPELGKGDKP